jgi:transposase
MKRISVNIKKQIIALRSRKFTTRETASRLNISEVTVKNYSKMISQKIKRNKGGRPRKINYDISKIFVEKFDNNKLQFLNDGRSMLKEKYEIEVTRQTVKNYLN